MIFYSDFSVSGCFAVCLSCVLKQILVVGTYKLAWMRWRKELQLGTSSIVWLGCQLGLLGRGLKGVLGFMFYFCGCFIQGW